MVTTLFLNSEQVGALRISTGRDVVVNHTVGVTAETLVNSGIVDALIVDTEDGFSDLGMMRDFVSSELGFGHRDLVRYALAGFPDKLERNIASLADWNRARIDDVTLVAIPSERLGSQLKGLILAPYDGSAVYKKFSYPGYRAHRDFMYGVTYEAIQYAYKRWGARRIGVTHLARAKHNSKFDNDVTTCQVEAMLHFSESHLEMESFTFLDTVDGNRPLQIVDWFNSMQDVGTHRPLKTSAVEFWGLSFIDLDLSASAKTSRGLKGPIG